MNLRFEELDWQPTPLGEFTLRRRHDLTVDQDVYEVKLGEEFLMSSLFTVAEIELARLGPGRPRPPRTVRAGRRTRARLHRPGRAGRSAGFRGDGDRGRRAGARLAPPQPDPGHRRAGHRPTLPARPRRLLPPGRGRSGDDLRRDPARHRSHAEPSARLRPRRLLQRRRPDRDGQAPPAGRRVRAVVGRPARPGLPGGPARGLRRADRRAGVVRQSDHRRRVQQHRSTWAGGRTPTCRPRRTSGRRGSRGPA